MNEYYTDNLYQQNFKKHLLSTFGWMFLGLAITFMVSFALGTNTDLLLMFVSIPMIEWILIIAQFGIVIAFAARIYSCKPSTVKALFIAYSFITGLSFSYLPLVFGVRSIASAFALTCMFFACLVAIGLTTNKDLTKLGTICMAGLMASIVYSLFGLIFGFMTNSFIYSFIVLLLFVGLTAYDVQKIKTNYYYHAENPELLSKLGMYSALELYLDFINIFLRVLSILGNKD